MSESTTQSGIKEKLLDDDAFVGLLEAFMQRSISEECDGNGVKFGCWYSMALDTHVKKQFNGD